jgi:hypothetical protein
MILFGEASLRQVLSNPTAAKPHDQVEVADYQVWKDGGAEGIRTPDPHNAIVVLYQLSYDPIRSDRESRSLLLFVKEKTPPFPSLNGRHLIMNSRVFGILWPDRAAI